MVAVWLQPDSESDVSFAVAPGNQQKQQKHKGTKAAEENVSDDRASNAQFTPVISFKE